MNRIVNNVLAYYCSVQQSHHICRNLYLSVLFFPQKTLFPLEPKTSMHLLTKVMHYLLLPGNEKRVIRKLIRKVKQYNKSRQK